uniref:Interleukin 12 receptor subunit beta 2 n=1 Tax=Anser cygnoides TaxID=8845 RepID=A0A8B9IP06_ANSCY
MHTPFGEPNQCLPPGAALKPSQAAHGFGTIKVCLQCTECWWLGFYCYLLFPLSPSPCSCQKTEMVRDAFSFQALSKSEARGRILQYTVTFEALNHGGSKAVEAEVTTQTSYTRTTAKMDYRITVTADNSRGSSPPAAIVTDLGIGDLPPPQKVSALPTGNGSILVSWKPPDKSTAFINGYVVEWMDTHRKKSLEPHPTWIKLVASNLSTVISENVKDNVCYDIRVFALYLDRAGRVASVRGYSREQAISNATSQREFYITNLQRGENYVLWMTASTAAGESPWGNRELVCLESAVDWLIIVLMCSFFVFSVCVCSMRPARKVLYSLLSATVPQWHNKAIPDPANATWAKSCASVKGELSVPSSLFLRDTSSFEEPETIEVEEGFIKADSQIFQDKLIFSNVHGSENHDWHSESSFEKQESEYKALPSTTDGDSYEHQLPYLYRKMAEVTEQMQSVSEYLANPITDRALGYLPAGILSPATDTTDEHQELECSPISVFPTTFLTPVFSYGGKLNLDTVRLNCSSFTR